MKGIYVIYNSIINNKGVVKKIASQISAFNKLGLSVLPYYVSGPKGLWGAFLRFSPLTDSFENWSYNLDIDELNFIYIRKPIITRNFIMQLRLIKRNKPEIIILVEFPTYPYDQEFKNKLTHQILKFKDIINRKKLKKYVDRIVTYSDDSYIFGVKTIRVENGIEIQSDKFRIVPEFINIFNMIGVANISLWHGFDRIIYGLKKYYQKEQKVKAIFHIVGQGSALEDLKRITTENSLDNFVHFHGTKTGSELDNIYAKCDLGIGSLGMHRIGVFRGSTLKIREYCQIGLPFIYAYNDIDFDNFPYCRKYPNDNTPVDIEDIINFVCNLNKSNKYLEMKTFAENNLSWGKKIEPIVKYLKLNNKSQ